MTERDPRDTPPILMIVDRLIPADGGLFHAVRGISMALAQAGTRVHLLAVAHDDTRLPPDTPGLTTQLVPRATGRFARLVASALREAVRGWARQHPGGVAHIHGIWRPEIHAACVAARRAGLPVMVTTHSMLMPWSLRQKWLKKRIAGLLYQWRDLRRVQLLHATSPAEAEGTRASGFTRVPLAMVPNGVDRPPAATHDTVVAEGDHTRRILFLSRLHPGKRPLDLIDAFARVNPPPAWKLVIAGVDSGGHGQRLRQAIAAHGIGDRVELISPLDDDAKWDVYRTAALFVLPTANESFGLAIAEAMRCGLPVITTRGAPWAAIDREQCGRWIDHGVEPLTAALRELIALGDDERRAMGERGRAYVESEFSWGAAADRTSELYQWLAGHVERPDSVSPPE
ncbi:MAG: glycosyltransferase [Planctomycetota bacterium]